MDIDLKKLVRISDFKPEDKKAILDNFDKLSSDAIMELWQLCLENLQWKLEIEFSKKFHDKVFTGAAGQKDTYNYKDLEKEILLDIFTKAEVEARDEEIESVRKKLSEVKLSQVPVLSKPQESGTSKNPVN